MLREATLVAIDELGVAVSGECTRLLRERGGSAAELSEALAELGDLLGVLETIG